ncbi:MAG TPA: hypothetical protein VHV51_24060 [Polyangiaceae bacterium]|jgi:hypothetical protein|nr:hypothetical protein [Polyangiaceae bacterium]
MKRTHSLKVALFFAGVCAVGAVASCSEDGVTPNCPALPLYQTYPLGDASRPDALSGDSGAADEARNAAIAAGCLTGPNGFVPNTGGSSGAGGSSAGNAGNGGSSGASGGAGKGGSGGKPSTSIGESGSGAENAGAAGRN